VRERAVAGDQELIGVEVTGEGSGYRLVVVRGGSFA
jgi:hypothetical protein